MAVRGIDAGVFAYMGGGTAIMDKADKNSVHYERGGSLLVVERHFTGEHTVSELVRSFARGCGPRRAELTVVPLDADAAGWTADAEDLA